MHTVAIVADTIGAGENDIGQFVIDGEPATRDLWQLRTHAARIAGLSFSRCTRFEGGLIWTMRTIPGSLFGPKATHLACQAIGEAGMIPVIRN